MSNPHYNTFMDNEMFRVMAFDCIQHALGARSDGCVMDWHVRRFKFDSGVADCVIDPAPLLASTVLQHYGNTIQGDRVPKKIGVSDISSYYNREAHILSALCDYHMQGKAVLAVGNVMGSEALACAIAPPEGCVDGFLGTPAEDLMSRFRRRGRAIASALDGGALVPASEARPWMDMLDIDEGGTVASGSLLCRPDFISLNAEQDLRSPWKTIYVRLDGEPLRCTTSAGVHFDATGILIQRAPDSIVNETPWEHAINVVAVADVPSVHLGVSTVNHADGKPRNIVSWKSVGGNLGNQINQPNGQAETLFERATRMGEHNVNMDTLTVEATDVHCMVLNIHLLTKNGAFVLCRSLTSDHGSIHRLSTMVLGLMGKINDVKKTRVHRQPSERLSRGEDEMTEALRVLGGDLSKVSGREKRRLSRKLARQEKALRGEHNIVWLEPKLEADEKIKRAYGKSGRTVGRHTVVEHDHTYYVGPKIDADGNKIPNHLRQKTVRRIKQHERGDPSIAVAPREYRIRVNTNE